MKNAPAPDAHHPDAVERGKATIRKLQETGVIDCQGRRVRQDLPPTCKTTLTASSALTFPNAQSPRRKSRRHLDNSRSRAASTMSSHLSLQGGRSPAFVSSWLPGNKETELIHLQMRHRDLVVLPTSMPTIILAVVVLARPSRSRTRRHDDQEVLGLHWVHLWSSNELIERRYSAGAPEMLSGAVRPHATQIIDALGDLQRMVKLFPGMNLQFSGDVHVCGPFEHLRVVDIGNDRLIFASQIFIQSGDKLLASFLLSSRHAFCSCI